MSYLDDAGLLMDIQSRQQEESASNISQRYRMGGKKGGGEEHTATHIYCYIHTNTHMYIYIYTHTYAI